MAFRIFSTTDIGQEALQRLRDKGWDLEVYEHVEPPPGLAESLFEPFATTKEPGAGLGLGLAISTGIVVEFGGSLVAANLPGGGAEFTIDLASGGETNDA